MTDKARELYNEGRELYGHQQWAKAHASFLAAWSLKEHWQIAGMLGHCEIELGRYRDAAAHLAFSVRTGAGSASDEEMERLRKALQVARERVGAIDVQAEPAGAEVLVDGKVAGTSPLEDPVFVEPGKHLLQARMGNKTSPDVTVELGAGGTRTISLRADREGEAVGPTTPEEPKLAEREGRSVVPAIVGGAVALIGLGAGVGFTLSAKDKESDRDDKLASIGGVSACGVGTPLVTECADVQDLSDTAGSRRTMGTVGFVVGGAAAVATATYLLWPASDSGPSARVAPSLGIAGGGVSVVGRF